MSEFVTTLEALKEEYDERYKKYLIQLEEERKKIEAEAEELINEYFDSVEEAIKLNKQIYKD